MEKLKNPQFDWKSSKMFDWSMEVLLLVMVFLVPILFDRRLGIVFSGTKIAWLRAFVVIALGIWSCKILILKKHQFIRTLLDWPIVSFLLCVSVATLTSVHVYTSFVGFYGRYEGLSTWFIYGALFFITTNYVKSFEQIKRVIVMVIPAATIMAIYSILQRHSLDPYMWGGVITWQRVIGTIGQPNFMAAFMLMAFFLVLALFLFENEGESKQIDWQQQILPVSSLILVPCMFLLMIYNLDADSVILWYSGFFVMTFISLIFAFKYNDINSKITKVILGIVLLLVYIALLYTQSRGGYMGLFSGTVLFALLIGRKWLLNHYKKFAVLLALIVLVSGITMLQPEFSPLQRFTDEVNTKKDKVASQNDTSLELKGAAGSRTETWTSGFHILADNSLFGIGPEVLKMVFPRYETDLFRFKEAFHVKQDRNHNETMDVSVTKGLVAFFVYLWLIVTFFQSGIKKVSKVGNNERFVVAGLLAAALSYLVQNQFSFGVVAITFLFWIIWALVMAIGSNEVGEPVGKPKTLSLGEIPWLSVAVVIVLCTAAIYVSFLSFYGDIWFKSGKTQLDMRRVSQAAADLEKSLQIYPLEGGTISHLGITYLNSSPTGYDKNEMLTKAIATLKYGTKIDPYNADNYFILAKTYFMLSLANDPSALQQAILFANIALKIDPYYAEVYLLLGMITEKNGNFAEAAKLYEKAFFVNPTLVEPMKRMEGVYNQLGKPDEALRVLESVLKKYGDSILVLNEAGSIYLQKGKYDRALSLCDRMIGSKPNDPAGYLLRAEVFLQQKKIDLAFADFQQVVMLDPKNIGAHSGLVKIFLIRGDKERAKEELNQILMLDPSNAFAKEMLPRLP